MTHEELMAEIHQEIERLGLIVHGNCRASWGSGFPDLIISGPGGLIFREVKTERGRLESAQWIWAEHLIKNECDWQVWRPHEWPEIIKYQLGRLAKV